MPQTFEVCMLIRTYLEWHAVNSMGYTPVQNQWGMSPDYCIKLELLSWYPLVISNHRNLFGDWIRLLEFCLKIRRLAAWSPGKWYALSLVLRSGYALYIKRCVWRFWKKNTFYTIVTIINVKISNSQWVSYDKNIVMTSIWTLVTKHIIQETMKILQPFVKALTLRCQIIHGLMGTLYGRRSANREGLLCMPEMIRLSNFITVCFCYPA